MFHSAYYKDITFQDHDTNDVPEKWLKRMQQFLDTGKWLIQ